MIIFITFFMKLDYLARVEDTCILENSQVINPVVAAIPDMVSLLEQISSRIAK